MPWRMNDAVPRATGAGGRSPNIGMDDTGKCGTGGKPRFVAKMFRGLYEVPGRSTYLIGRSAQVIDSGAGGRD